MTKLCWLLNKWLKLSKVYMSLAFVYFRTFWFITIVQLSTKVSLTQFLIQISETEASWMFRNAIMRYHINVRINFAVTFQVSPVSLLQRSVTMMWWSPLFLKIYETMREGYMWPLKVYSGSVLHPYMHRGFHWTTFTQWLYTQPSLRYATTALPLSRCRFSHRVCGGMPV